MRERKTGIDDLQYEDEGEEEGCGGGGAGADSDSDSNYSNTEEADVTIGVNCKKQGSSSLEQIQKRRDLKDYRMEKTDKEGLELWEEGLERGRTIVSTENRSDTATAAAAKDHSRVQQYRFLTPVSKANRNRNTKTAPGYH